MNLKDIFSTGTFIQIVFTLQYINCRVCISIVTSIKLGLIEDANLTHHIIMLRLSTCTLNLFTNIVIQLAVSDLIDMYHP